MCWVLEGGLADSSQGSMSFVHMLALMAGVRRDNKMVRLEPVHSLFHFFRELFGVECKASSVRENIGVAVKS